LVGRSPFSWPCLRFSCGCRTTPSIRSEPPGRPGVHLPSRSDAAACVSPPNVRANAATRTIGRALCPRAGQGVGSGAPRPDGATMLSVLSGRRERAWIWSTARACETGFAESPPRPFGQHPVGQEALAAWSQAFSGQQVGQHACPRAGSGIKRPLKTVHVERRDATGPPDREVPQSHRVIFQARDVPMNQEEKSRRPWISRATAVASRRCLRFLLLRETAGHCRLRWPRVEGK